MRFAGRRTAIILAVLLFGLAAYEVSLGGAAGASWRTDDATVEAVSGPVAGCGVLSTFVEVDVRTEGGRRQTWLLHCWRDDQYRPSVGETCSAFGTYETISGSSAKRSPISSRGTRRYLRLLTCENGSGRQSV